MTPSTINRRASVSGFGIKSSVSVLALATSLAVSTPTFAQDKSFDIDPGPAAATLNQLAEQADVSVVYSFDVVDGITTNEVEGSFEVFEALEMLVEGTGLTVVNGTGGAYAVRLAEFEGQDTNAPVQTAQLDPEVEVPVVKIEPVAVTGTVIAEGSEANLKGAQVEIVETGQTTATDDLGRFRFSSIVPGDYTLRITFLGRNPIIAMVKVGAQDFRQTFVMSNEWQGDMITVYGTRSARAQSLNLERTAENSSTVLAADLLGNFNGTTISEALRRAPGVAFQQDADTGDGTNIILRGLSPDFNTVQFNGVELPEGTGVGRSASLNNILADSIEKVTISKTLLPNQDSSGTGGLVEIETKSPLDRSKRFAQFSVEGAWREKDFSEGLLATSLVSGIFGKSDNIGLGASLQYRDRSAQTLTAGNSLLFGAYLPLDALGGTSYSLGGNPSVPPGNAFPYESSPGANDVYASSLSSSHQNVDITDLALGLSGAFQIHDHTSFRLDYQHLENTRSTARARYSLTPSGGYLPRPVVALGGEVRPALRTPSTVRIRPSYTLDNDVETITDIFTFRGETNLQKWNFGYNLSYTEGSTKTPESFALVVANGRRGLRLPDGAISPEAVDIVEQIPISLFRPIISDNDSPPIPLFSSTGLALVNDPSGYLPGFGAALLPTGENSRWAGGLSTKYDVSSSTIRYIEVGFDFELSEFSNQLQSKSISGAPGVTLADLGVPFDRGIYDEIGVEAGLLAPSIGAIRDLFSNLDGFSESGLLNVQPISSQSNLIGAGTEETELSPYIQSRLEFGDLELVGGFRFPFVETAATAFQGPTFTSLTGGRDLQWQEDNTFLVTQKASQSEVLPRFLFNYRPNENTVFRLGYHLTLARPRIQDLNDTVQVNLDLRPVFGANRDQARLRIQEGNEELEPARTDNFDVSFERYFSDIGVIKVSGFYKSIENLIELNFNEGTEFLDGVILPDFTSADGFPVGYDITQEAQSGRLLVERTRPVNNPGKAHIWGVELAAERKLNFLPAFWNDFGVYANYVFTDSSKDQPINFFDTTTFERFDIIAENVRFNQQPEHSGTIGVTYQNESLDANLFYTFQSDRQTSFAFNGLSSFVDAVDSLDFRIVYSPERFKGSYRLAFEVTDILKDAYDPGITTSRTDSRYVTSRSYFGGREFRIGLTATF